MDPDDKEDLDNAISTVVAWDSVNSTLVPGSAFADSNTIVFQLVKRNLDRSIRRALHDYERFGYVVEYFEDVVCTTTIDLLRAQLQAIRYLICFYTKEYRHTVYCGLADLRPVDFRMVAIVTDLMAAYKV
jgi:hypothetical protein